jgi:hypothetical protein
MLLRGGGFVVSYSKIESLEGDKLGKRIVWQIDKDHYQSETSHSEKACMHVLVPVLLIVWL